MPGLHFLLFEKFNRSGYSKLRFPIAQVEPAIFGHDEFTAFNASATQLFNKWEKVSTPLLKGFAQSGHPKPLIENIAENLLTTFKTAPLIDAYDIYQHLMDFWAEIMQDDCYLIADAGWIIGAQPREILQVENKDKKLVWPESHDFKRGSRRYKSDLIPAAVLVARYFLTERDAIAALETELAGIEQQMEELTEENSGEDGVLREVTSKAEAETVRADTIVGLWQEFDSKGYAHYTKQKEIVSKHSNKIKLLSDNQYLTALRNGRGKLTLAAVKNRLRNISPGNERDALADYINTVKDGKEAEDKADELFAAVEPHFISRLSELPLPEELGDLNAVVRFISLLDKLADAKAQLRAAQEDLDAKLDAKYPILTEDEIKTLVVDDKWLVTIAAAVRGELDRVSQTLTGRIRQLAERYATPLPQLRDEVATLANLVDGHLKRMGALWK
jgi:type I restriction enzyme M protein